MFRTISKKTGLAALALGALTLASTATVTSAQAGWHGGGGGYHGGGHGGWGGYHAGYHGHWGHGGYWGVYGRPYVVARSYGCYRAWRTAWIPGEGYVRTRVRVCD